MSKLYVVSNRLPLTIEKKDGGYTCRQSSGGLVSAVSAYLDSDVKGSFSEIIWAGVPDCSENAWRAAMAGDTGANYKYLPVFLNKRRYDLYYNGFSNSIVWPLFHYFPSFADYNSGYYDAYREANEIFAECLLSALRKEDTVWIHDYHLLPLAALLRERLPGITIGFFLHVPFPSYEIFRVLPKEWQKTMLEGMLGADLIGFHTLDYAAHFLSCVDAILKPERDGQFISWHNRQVKADAFPISIDFDSFNNAYDEPEVKRIRKSYLEMKGDRKLLFSVDRLDYTKGISNRLKGYERFLEENPEYAEKVVFALNIVPSRDSISRYAERKKMIDEYIGNINSRVGNIRWQPILYQYNHVTFNELVALYTACDLALITPLRDGMNLVAKEFVASRRDRHGVLVLSEMAGAAKELTEALLINPNDTAEIAAMIKYGLEMPADEQEQRMTAMQTRIAGYDVVEWARDFFEQLKTVKELQLEFEVKFIDNMTRVDLIDKYARAGKALFLLDYDGSLMPFQKLPMLAKPSEEVLAILEQLAANARNDVYIISGRSSQSLSEWFGGLNVGLVAEHGARVRHVGGAWETDLNDDGKNWMPQIEKIMLSYVGKCPHSFIERKDFSLAWHYRNAEPMQGTVRARELFDALKSIAGHDRLNVLNGHKVIEVRNGGINKGLAAGKIYDAGKYDFVLAVGDDQTDEDMFRRLARVPDVFTIKVGSDASFARYNLHNPFMVQSLLQTIAHYENAALPVRP